MIYGHKLKNKVVHLSASHCITFGNFTALSPIGKLKYLLQKEIVLLTIGPPVLLGKSPFLCPSFLVLYKKKNWLGCPKWPLGSPTFQFPTTFYKILNYTKIWSVLLMRRVPLGLPRTFSMLLLQQRDSQTSWVPGTECSARICQLGSEWPQLWPCSNVPIPPRAVY